MKKILTGDETNLDLKNICDELNLTVEAKNTQKPNKMELITAIEKYNKVDDADEASETETEGLDEDISEEEYKAFMEITMLPLLRKMVKLRRRRLK